MISVAEKARIRKNCRRIRSVMNMRCRLRGSWAVWFWLARIMRGRSQQVKINSGVESISRAIKVLTEVQLDVGNFISNGRLASAIIKLWRVVVGQSHLAGTIQVTGTSMKVAIRISSIVTGSGFAGGRSRGYGQWLLVKQGLRLLHMLRMQGEVWEMLKSLWSLVVGSIRRGQ